MLFSVFLLHKSAEENEHTIGVLCSSLTLCGESLYLAKQTAPASGTLFHHEARPSPNSRVTEATVTDVSPGRKENPRGPECVSL